MSLLKRGPATSDGRPLTAVERDSAREAAAQALRQELTPKAIIDKTPAAMARAGEFLPQFMRRWLEEVRHQDPTLHLSQQDIDGLATQVYQQIFGLGFLEAYLPPQRTDLSEISILPDGRVTVQRKGAQRFEVTDQQISRSQMDDILQRLLGAMSRSISQAWPIEGTRIPPTANLPTGARVHAVAPPVVVGHMATLNVRLFESKFVTPQTLLGWGSVTPEMDAFLAERISEGCGVLVSGATGSGKTTFLNYLSYYIHQYDRVITVEDSQELRLSCPAGDRSTHGFWITLETRPPNLEGQGEITFLKLINTSLRMTPQWVIVGEIREGAVAAALLQTQISGHSGMTTIHADSTHKAIKTLLMRCQQSEMFSTIESAKQAIVLGLDLVIQLEQNKDGDRYVQEIAMVDPNLIGGKVYVRSLWKLDRKQSQPGAPVWQTPTDLGRTYVRHLEDDQEEVGI